MKKLPLVLAILACSTAPSLQAKVLHDGFSLGAGYWFELNHDSEKSNHGDQSVVSGSYRAKTDWGSTSVRGLIENIGGTNDTPKGFAVTSLKTFSDTLIDIGETPFSFWVSHQTVGNNKISDNHFRAGMSYAHKIGPVNLRVSLAPEYYFGHSPHDEADGIHLFGRTILSYKLADNVSQAFIFENVNFRNHDLQKGIGWKADGYHYMLNTNIKFNKNWSTTLQLHKFESFGGYKCDGASAYAGLNYTF